MPQGISDGNYTIAADIDGISFGSESYAWSSFSNGTEVLDIDNVTSGNWSINTNGLTISFTTDSTTQKEDIINAINNARFELSTTTEYKNVVSLKDYKLVRKSNTDMVLNGCSFLGQDTQMNDTMIYANSEGLVLKHYNSNNGGYTDEVGRISWNDLGVNWDDPSGDYWAKDDTSGIEFEFTINEQSVIDAMNGTKFEVSYGDMKIKTVYYDNFFPDEINYLVLDVWHDSQDLQGGDFFTELGYDLEHRSELIGGINVEVYLVNDGDGKTALQYVAPNGRTKTTNKTFDAGTSYVGYQTATGLGYGEGVTSNAIFSLNCPNNTEIAFMNDLFNSYDDGSGKVKLADVRIPDYFRLNMDGFKQVSVSERKINNVTTVPYNVDDLPDSSDQNNTINDLSSVVPDRLSSLVRGSSLSLWIQSGPDATDGMNINIDNMTVDTLGLSDVNVSTEILATESIDKIANALEKLSSIRSSIGAQQNRLEHTYNNVKNTSENTQAAESRIRDTDMSKEMVAYSKHNILEQVGTAMVTQANQSTQGVLNLIQ